ncbi:MAG: putative manganese transporter [Clostridia bacterium]
MGEVFLDAFIDSLKVLAVLIVCNFLIALIEPKLSGKIKLKGKLAPLIGTTVGLLPQCGFSVVATDLYQKRHITVGTLLGVYLATSDEALPIFLSSPESALHILPILALKFVIGLVVGYSVDLICSKNRKRVDEHLQECDEQYQIRLTERIGDSKIEPTSCEECALNKTTACDHCENECSKNKAGNAMFDCATVLNGDENSCGGENNAVCNENSHCDSAEKCETTQKNEDKHKSTADKKEKLEQFLWHPLIHSLKIFIYILVVNIVFGIIIFYVGQDKMIAFLMENKYIAPLFAVLIGAVPNCVSSVILSELYIMGGLGFGATLAGLCMNAGLGFVVLLKNTKCWKENMAIIGTMFVISLVVGYIFSAIFHFDVLYLI